MSKVVHFEIPVESLERAQKFYSIFGWKMNSVPGIGYVLVSTGPSDEKGPKDKGFINGGLLKRQDPIKTPVITINVDDIDAAMKSVENEGGKIVRGKHVVGTVGFSAYFTDTEGNLMGLWQAKRG